MPLMSQAFKILQDREDRRGGKNNEEISSLTANLQTEKV